MHLVADNGGHVSRVDSMMMKQMVTQSGLDPRMKFMADIGGGRGNVAM